MRQARITHLTSVHQPFDDRIFYKECKSLARAGYKVSLVVPHARDEVVDAVKLKALPVHTGRLSRMTCTAWQVYREAMRESADVYHFHDPELIAVGLLLRLRGKSVVYDIHEDVPRSVHSKYYLPSWLRGPVAWLAERFENFASRWFSALVPVTPVIAERFYGLNENIVILHNYALLEEFALHTQMAWSERPHSVAYVGGIARHRGICELVRAVDLLPESLGARLKLAGPFWPQDLKDDVSRLPGWNRIDALGVLDRAGVARLLGSVRAGLVVDYPEPNYLRAEPIKVYEYMSAGIPVIASDFPLWREIIEGAGCGMVVDATNPEAIAEGIAYLLTHPEEAQAMGNRGRAAVENHYNWENEQSKLLQLYADLTHHAC